MNSKAYTLSIVTLRWHAEESSSISRVFLHACCTNDKLCSAGKCVSDRAARSALFYLSVSDHLSEVLTFIKHCKRDSFLHCIIHFIFYFYVSTPCPSDDSFAQTAMSREQTKEPTGRVAPNPQPPTMQALPNATDEIPGSRIPCPVPVPGPVLVPQTWRRPGATHHTITAKTAASSSHVGPEAEATDKERLSRSCCSWGSIETRHTFDMLA